MQMTWETFWYEAKAWLENELGMSSELMHVHVGLGLFLLFAVVLRKYRYGMFLAWAIVTTMEAINEFLDALDWIVWTGTVNWPETAKDVGMTLFWPTVLLISWRWLGAARRHD